MQPPPTRILSDHLIESLIRWGRLSGPHGKDGHIYGYHIGHQPAAIIKPEAASKFASIWAAEPTYLGGMG